MGLVLYAQPLTDWFTRVASQRLSSSTVQRLAAPVGYLLATLAATMMSLPVMVYLSQHISLGSLLVNALILPVQLAVLMLSGIAVLLGMLWLPLTREWRLSPGRSVPVRIVEAFARLHGASLVVTRIPVLGVAVTTPSC